MRKLLLSIKPQYARQILAGTKKVEYRKQSPKDSDVKHVLVYQSNDIMKVVGEFIIDGIIEGTPQQVWEQTHEVGGISKRDYFAYFEGIDKAYAFKISQLVVFDNPLSLEEIGVRRAPMSYQYVDV